MGNTFLRRFISGISLILELVGFYLVQTLLNPPQNPTALVIFVNFVCKNQKEHLSFPYNYSNSDFVKVKAKVKAKTSENLGFFERLKKIQTLKM